MVLQRTCMYYYRFYIISSEKYKICRYHLYQITEIRRNISVILYLSTPTVLLSPSLLKSLGLFPGWEGRLAALASPGLSK